ncbi:MAG: hypothetical protein QOD02_3997 [Mycobacterium sp.]|jgi:hypothetical protein|nr:hypothetical protein [Mycobacterium sp.]MDT5252250.1 hypothetical protein [Mycobacterium sp.]MDT5342502.1 hypothetical protein [Mycobacterium sp.]MDT7770536.1 hypothetical protein [Mycobacterium sp.]
MAQTVRSPALRQRSARPADPGTHAPRRCAFIGTRGDRAIGLLMCRKGFRPSCRRRRSRCWTCCCRRSAPSGRGSWPAGRWSASDSGCWSEFYRVKADTALVRGHLARNGFAISCALAGMAGLTTAGTSPLSRCPPNPLRGGEHRARQHSEFPGRYSPSFLALDHCPHQCLAVSEERHRHPARKQQ